MKQIFFFIIVLSALLVNGCKNRSTTDQQAEKEDVAIQNYIKDHQLNATKLKSGIYYVITKKGNGVYPKMADTVTVEYKGYTLNGKVFDQSDSTGITFYLGGVITGWTLGIPHFDVGSKGTLLIPSALAYGEKGKGPIPPNTPLVFGIHLLKIVH